MLAVVEVAKARDTREGGSKTRPEKLSTTGSWQLAAVDGTERFACLKFGPVRGVAGFACWQLGAVRGVAGFVCWEFGAVRGREVCLLAVGSGGG